MSDPGRDLAPGEHDPRVARDEVIDGEVSDEPTREQLVQILAHSAFSGPLPPPGMLAQYNDAVPDGADRIVKMAEEQSSHRRKIESRGQIFAFLLALVAIVGGIVLIALGRSAEGLVPLLSAIAGLIGLFIYGEVRARSTRRIEPPEEPASGDTQA
jgi:uncharacterized membrane protein